MRADSSVSVESFPGSSSRVELVTRLLALKDARCSSISLGGWWWASNMPSRFYHRGLLHGCKGSFFWNGDWNQRNMLTDCLRIVMVVGLLDPQSHPRHSTLNMTEQQCEGGLHEGPYWRPSELVTVRSVWGKPTFVNGRECWMIVTKMSRGRCWERGCLPELSATGLIRPATSRPPGTMLVENHRNGLNRARG